MLLATETVRDLAARLVKCLNDDEPDVVAAFADNLREGYTRRSPNHYRALLDQIGRLVRAGVAQGAEEFFLTRMQYEDDPRTPLLGLVSVEPHPETGQASLVLLHPQVPGIDELMAILVAELADPIHRTSFKQCRTCERLVLVYARRGRPVLDCGPCAEKRTHKKLPSRKRGAPTKSSRRTRK